MEGGPIALPSRGRSGVRRLLTALLTAERSAAGLDTEAPGGCVEACTIDAVALRIAALHVRAAIDAQPLGPLHSLRALEMAELRAQPLARLIVTASLIGLCTIGVRMYASLGVALLEAGLVAVQCVDFAAYLCVIDAAGRPQTGWHWRHLVVLALNGSSALARCGTIIAGRPDASVLLFPFSAPLHPFLVLWAYRRLPLLLVELGQTVRRTTPLLVLLLATIGCSAIFSTLLFAHLAVGEPPDSALAQFATITRALRSLTYLATTVSFPDAILPFVQIDPLFAVLFCAFVVVIAFVYLPLLLAAICSEHDACAAEHAAGRAFELVRSLRLAYCALAHGQLLADDRALGVDVDAQSQVFAEVAWTDAAGLQLRRHGDAITRPPAHGLPHLRAATVHAFVGALTPQLRSVDAQRLARVLCAGAEADGASRHLRRVPRPSSRTADGSISPVAFEHAMQRLAAPGLRAGGAEEGAAAEPSAARARRLPPAAGSGGAREHEASAPSHGPRADGSARAHACLSRVLSSRLFIASLRAHRAMAVLWLLPHLAEARATAWRGEIGGSMLEPGECAVPRMYRVIVTSLAAALAAEWCLYAAVWALARAAYTLPIAPRGSALRAWHAVYAATALAALAATPSVSWRRLLPCGLWSALALISWACAFSEVLRLLTRLRAVQAEVRRLRAVLPALQPYLLLQLLCLHCFASLGIALWARLPSEAFEGTDFVQLGYDRALSFRNYPSAFLLLLQLLVSNAWNVTAEAFVHASGSPATWLYFVGFYYVNVLLLLNVLIGALIELYAKQRRAHPPLPPPPVRLRRVRTATRQSCPGSASARACLPGPSAGRWRRPADIPAPSLARPGAGGAQSRAEAKGAAAPSLTLRRSRTRQILARLWSLDDSLLSNATSATDGDSRAELTAIRTAGDFDAEALAGVGMARAGGAGPSRGVAGLAPRPPPPPQL